MNCRRSVAARVAGALLLSSLLLASVGSSVDASSRSSLAGDQAVLGDVKGARPPCESDADRRVEDLSRLAQWRRR